MTASPLSRPIAVVDVGPNGLTVDVIADEAERAALAEANEAVAVEELRAGVTVRPFGKDGVAVTGQVDAKVQRICVVTLEPFVEIVSEPIDVRFAPAAEVAAVEDGGEIELGPNDPPDPFVGGVIDVGAVVSEFLTLGLDPYPRKPGATFEQPSGLDGEGSAFAELRKLKRPDDGG
ncbi:hypothetical protein JOD31_000311 [Methylopila capsulata]|uniref:Metal-binding protein n=1 Tax=Methylopila capsulata TaxID=61654 RepID=A0A9W6MR65_9HYPH|nr:DUF177 domain-containing protein [Methylopila capsulata]MBM7850099.1 hypothetical protein [Methylopila capsulata]GLK55390.1 metal-binding protein [Methylopila capsulata]